MNLDALLNRTSNLLRSTYKVSEHATVTLSFLLLCRLDAVRDVGIQQEIAKNDTPYSLVSINSSDLSEKSSLFNEYIGGFSDIVKKWLNDFGFTKRIPHYVKSGVLTFLIEDFSQLDLSPNKVDELMMGGIVESVWDKFLSDPGSEFAEYYTPEGITRLMIELLSVDERDDLTWYDPTCGMCGMLSTVLSETTGANVYGQEINPYTHAMAQIGMVMRGVPLNNIRFGNTLTDDVFPNMKFDRMISNPPFGLSWKKEKPQVSKEHQTGEGGRFPIGLPRVSDGSTLFLQHLLSKMNDSPNGSRIAIVLNGSPLFTGQAGSGESKLRQHLIESDLIEAIIRLPEQLFQNTSIGTYIWLINNRKSKNKTGKVQLIDASRACSPMRRSQGDKRKTLLDSPNDSDITHIENIVGIFSRFIDQERDGGGKLVSAILDGTAFGCMRVIVERPLRMSFEVPDELDENILPISACKEVGNNLRTKQQSLFQDNASTALSLRDVLESVRKSHPNRYMLESSFVEDVTSVSKQMGVKIGKKDWKTIYDLCGQVDPEAEPCVDKHGKWKPNPRLRDNERVPLNQTIDEYMKKEVLPHVSDAWVDPSKTETHYEINMNRYFYEFTPLRSLEEIDADLRELEKEIKGGLKEILSGFSLGLHGEDGTE